MQPAAPKLTTQADIATTTMQPQNLILPSNKKTKKYASQAAPIIKPTTLPQQQHSATQPQFHLNKAYNVVSIHKTSTTSAHQQQKHHTTTTHMAHSQTQSPHLQQQQQSYATVANRPTSIAPGGAAGSQQQSTVICSGSNIMTVNTAELNSASIYNLTGQHRSHLSVGGGGSSGGIVDTNCHFIGNIPGVVLEMSKGGSSANVTESTANSNIHCTNSNAASNAVNGSNQSLISLSNTHIGITLGGSSSNTSYNIHDKTLLGVSCVDSRKCDYKNNNLLSQHKSSFQQAQEYVPSGNNNSGNSRSNQQSGIFRGPPPTSNAPRGAGGAGGPRHLHMPAMYPNVVLQQYSQFGQRQPTFQTPHIQYAPTPIPYYPYQYLPSLQQQPPHSRGGGVSVNTGVSIGNTMQPVQPGGPNGPLAGPGTSSSQLQLLTGAVQPATNTVIGVSGNGSGQVGVPPMVGVMPPNVAPQPVQVQPASRRRHQHRLQIIDPATKKNILDDLDKSNSNVENDGYQDQGKVTIMVNDSGIYAIHKLDEVFAHRLDNVMGQTPVVSAMSDAPSVEILPTPQKTKSKKIPIVSPKDGPESSTDISSAKADDSQSNIHTVMERLEQIHSQMRSVLDVDEKKDASESDLLLTEDPLENNSLLANPVEAVLVVPEVDASPSNQPENTQMQSLANNEVVVSKVSELADNVSIKEISDQSKQQSSDAATSSVLHEHVVESSSQIDEIPETNPDETDQAPQVPQIINETCNSIKANNASYESVDAAFDSIATSSTLATSISKDSETEREKDLELKNNDNETAKELQIIEKKEHAAPAAPSESEILSLIIYNDGQWSPSNPSGKKQYDREQLLQLREAKASRVQPEVKNVSILPHPNLMPTFMRNNNNNNKRVQSMVGVIGGNRNNDMSGSNFVGKQVSMSGVQGGRSSMKGMIHVNLSLNQDVKLNETKNAWRPRLVVKTVESEGASDGKSTQEKDELVRRVRGILNKLTPERFDTLVEEIVKLKIDTPDKMDEVIVLVFEKAIDEPNFSVSYARLCHRLISEVKARDERMESGTKSNLQHFRNALLDKTEKEFTQNVSQGAAKEKKLQPIVEKIKECTDPNEKAELEGLLEEEERKIRRRSGGTVRFIGELFKISMLTGKIIYSCIDTLLNPHSEDMLECLCKLLTTVGAKFEQTPVNAKEQPSRCYSLEKSIAKMQGIASKTDKDGAKISSRVRFMLQDVIDLRKNKWQSARNEAPKTMGQIEKEAKNEQLSAQYMNYSGSLSTSSPNGPQSGGSGGKRDDRNSARYSDSRSGYGGSHSQRGGDVAGNMRHQQPNSGVSNSGNNASGASVGNSNGHNDDNTWHVQTSKGSRSQAVDSNKLEGLTLQLNQNLDTKKMGGVNQFIWSNVNRQSSTPTTTPSNSFAVLSSLIDKNSTDRDRDRSGPRNKSSYNKGSMERDRYSGDRGIHSRTGSSQRSRENSSSRIGQNQQNRGGMMHSSLQKSASHSKYTQQSQPNRLSNKGVGSSAGIYRGNDQQQPLLSASNSFTPAAQPVKSQPAPVAVFIEPREIDNKLFKTVVTDIVDLAATSKLVPSMAIECIKRIPDNQRSGFLFYILTDYLHLYTVGKQSRRYLAITIAYFIQQNYMSVDNFKLAYKEFSKYAKELAIDIPELWLYILQFSGPLIVKNVLTVSDLWNNELRDNNMGEEFLKTYLTYCTREVGPNFTRTMWKTFNMRWSDFIPESDINDFIESNRLQYVENESKPPVIKHRDSPEKHVKNVIEHIEHLLKEGADADCIIDYCNGNIVLADKLFIKGLTTTLCNFVIAYKDNSYKLEPEVFQKFCIPVFQRFIDINEDLQLECLYAVQLLVNSLEHPRGLLNELFGELYDGCVIQKESLYKWRDSKDQSAGKGVAVKSLNPFFNSLYSDETN